MKISISELKAFLGCLYTMGIIRFQNYSMYWESGTRLFNCPGMKDLFTLQRFRDIWSCICFRDIEEDDEEDRLFKIRAVISTILTNSQTFYTPDCDLYVDEAMISFSGRHNLVQCMPFKPIKYGFKAFVLCESKSSYVLNWRMYTADPLEYKHGATYMVPDNKSVTPSLFFLNINKI